MNSGSKILIRFFVSLLHGEHLMKKGICEKCGAAAICAAEMGFQQDSYEMPLGGMFDGVITVTRRNYVCTECGYHEQYIVEIDNLKKIEELAAGNIRGWTRVPVS